MFFLIGPEIFYRAGVRACVRACVYMREIYSHAKIDKTTPVFFRGVSGFGEWRSGEGRIEKDKKEKGRREKGKGKRVKGKEIG